MLSNMDLKQQTIDTYERTAGKMAEKFNAIGPRIEDIERGFSFIDKQNPSVLEIGCGNGRDAKVILKHTNRYLGIDISESMIKIARKSVPNGAFEVSDIEAFTLPKNIDIVFSFASLLHSEAKDVQDILISVHEALSENGIFYISLKYGNGMTTTTDRFGTRTYYFYTPKDIEGMAAQKYEVLWSDRQEVLSQDWFTIVLKKR